MTKLFARFLVALVNLATVFLSRWRKLTVRARVHDGLAPQTTVTVNGVDLTLLVPDRTSVYWSRHGFDSEPNTLSWIDRFSAGDVGVLGVEIIAGTVHVEGLAGNEVAAVLAAVGLAQLDASDLGDGVGFVGRLQWSGQ